MASLPESSTFDAGVYQLELTDPVIGGPSGVSNEPLKNLANRTRFLKDRVDLIEADLTGLAPINSPALTGTPTAPTPAASANNTQVATAAFVKTAIAASAVDLSALAPKVSPTFTGDPKAPTPALFDNDTSLATSEFVRASAQQYRDLKTYTTNTTLTAADIGCLIVVSNGATITLPPTTGIPNGQAFTILNGASQTVTIVSPAGGSFYPPGEGNTQIKLEQYDSAEVMTYGSNNYLLTKGSAQAGRQWRYRTSFAANGGYTWLPNGLLLQWGQYDGQSYNPSTTYFPIAFPNDVLVVQTQNTAGNGVGPYLNGRITKALFDWELFSNTGAPISLASRMRWFALGY